MFEVVEDDDAGNGRFEAKIQKDLAQAAKLNDAARKGLLLAVGQLSQRAMAGWSALFSVIGLASLWYLVYIALVDPTTPRLVGIGMYGAFWLILEVIRRKIK